MGPGPKTPVRGGLQPEKLFGALRSRTAITLRMSVEARRLRDNAAARHLYERLGFEQVAVRRGYYGPGRDALVLRRWLSAGTDAS